MTEWLFSAFFTQCQATHHRIWKLCYWTHQQFIWNGNRQHFKLTTVSSKYCSLLFAISFIYAKFKTIDSGCDHGIWFNQIKYTQKSSELRPGFNFRKVHQKYWKNERKFHIWLCISAETWLICGEFGLDVQSGFNTNFHRTLNVGSDEMYWNLEKFNLSLGFVLTEDFPHCKYAVMCVRIDLTSLYVCMFLLSAHKKFLLRSGRASHGGN